MMTMKSLLALILTFTVFKLYRCDMDAQIIFYCGKPSLVKRQDGWKEDFSQDCLENESDIVKYCMKSYPNLQIVNAEPANEKIKIEKWCSFSQNDCKFNEMVRPFKCLGKDFQSDKITLPRNCNFGHLTHENCNNYKLLKKEAQDACTNKAQELHSYGMTFPCKDQPMVFYGVEFICCHKEMLKNPEHTSKIKEFFKDSVVSSEKEEQENYIKKERDLINKENKELKESYEKLNSNGLKFEGTKNEKYYKSLVNQFKGDKENLLRYHLDRLSFVYNVRVAAFYKRLKRDIQANNVESVVEQMKLFLNLYETRKQDLSRVTRHIHQLNLNNLLPIVEQLTKENNQHKTALMILMDNNNSMKTEVNNAIAHYKAQIETDHLSQYLSINEHITSFKDQHIQPKTSNKEVSNDKKIMSNRVPTGGNGLSDASLFMTSFHMEQSSYEMEHRALIQSELERFNDLFVSYQNHLHDPSPHETKKQIVDRFKTAHQLLLNQFQNNKRQLFYFHIERIQYIFDSKVADLSLNFKKRFNKKEYTDALSYLKELLTMFHTHSHNLDMMIKHARDLKIAENSPTMQLLDRNKHQIPLKLGDILDSMNNDKSLKHKVDAEIDKYVPALGADHLVEYDNIHLNARPFDQPIDVHQTENGHVHYDLGLNDPDQKEYHEKSKFHQQTFLKPLLLISLSVFFVLIIIGLLFIAMVMCKRQRHNHCQRNHASCKFTGNQHKGYQKFDNKTIAVKQQRNSMDNDYLSLPRGFGFNENKHNSEFEPNPIINSYENPTYNILENPQGNNVTTPITSPDEVVAMNTNLPAPLINQ